MAEKVTGDPEKKARKKKAPAAGHNLEDLRKKLAPFVKGITDAYDDMEEDHGSHVLTIAAKFEKAAESTGFPKGLLRTEIARIRRKQKEEAKEIAMDDDEREDTERFRACMDGTPMGKWAQGSLARPAA